MSIFKEGIQTIYNDKGSYFVFDSESFNIFKKNKSLKTLSKDSYFEFRRKGIIHWPSDKEELLQTHEGGGKLFLADIENKLADILISTTDCRYKNNDLDAKLIEQILIDFKNSLTINLLSNISVNSEKIVICRDDLSFVQIECDKGTFEIKEIYDASYKENLDDENSIIRAEKENEKLINTDKFNDRLWIARKDFSVMEPNIHFLCIKKIV